MQFRTVRLIHALIGGLVGMIGVLGGFVLPLAFGSLLDLTGVWTSCFVLLFVLVSVAITWMHFAVRQMERAAMRRGEAGQVPELPEMQGFGEPGITADAPPATKSTNSAACRTWLRRIQLRRRGGWAVRDGVREGTTTGASLTSRSRTRRAATPGSRSTLARTVGRRWPSVTVASCRSTTSARGCGLLKRFLCRNPRNSR